MSFTIVAVSMIFRETRLPGVFEIGLEAKADNRGFFARTWCQTEFETHGLNSRLVQCSLSHSVWQGTLRGMHYQVAPYAETKLVRCTKGAVYDVILDLLPPSTTFKTWTPVVLTPATRTAHNVP